MPDFDRLLIEADVIVETPAGQAHLVGSDSKLTLTLENPGVLRALLRTPHGNISRARALLALNNLLAKMNVDLTVECRNFVSIRLGRRDNLVNRIVRGLN